MEDARDVMGAQVASAKAPARWTAWLWLLLAAALLPGLAAAAANPTLSFNYPAAPEMNFAAPASVKVQLSATSGCGPINIYVTGPGLNTSVNNGDVLNNLPPGRYFIDASFEMCDRRWVDPVGAGRAFNVIGGSITASPASCTIPWGGSNCPSTINWSSNAANAQVWYSQLDGSAMTPWVSGQSGSTVGYINSPGLRFYLKSGDLTLASVDVAAVPTQNGGPAVTMTAPAPNHIYQIDGAVRFAANASDPDDGVQRVEFLLNGNKVGEDTSAPYEMNWTGLDGGYTVTARAFDTRGAQTTSAGVWIYANGRPSITLTSPANGAQATVPASFLLKADASDVDGVKRVEFYADNTLVNTDSAAPYEFNWAGVSAGTHTVYAIVHDNLGASVRSATATVSVTRPPSGPGGVTRRYVYDQRQRVCKIIEPETGATVMDYDAAGNLAWSAAGLDLPDPNNCNTAEGYASGRRSQRVYDQRNRLQNLMFPDGRGNQTWRYYPDGQVKDVVTDNDGPSQGTVVNTYEYNRRRLLTRESVGQAGLYNWISINGYNALGQLRWQTYPSGFSVDYAPNALGQPTHVRSADQIFANTVRYHPNGAIASFTYGNGRVHSMIQNARQLPQRVNNGAIDFTYEYDANANPIRIRDVNAVDGTYSGHRDLHYDKLNRISMADLYWHKTETYTYDVLDNIQTRRDYWSGATQNYWYDARNRLTNIQNDAGATIVGLGYDAQGNLENKNGQAYQFDYGNRLRAVVGKEIYRYDAHGRRTWIQRVSDGWTDGAIYTQAGQLQYEWKNRSGERNEHLYLGGSLLATRTRYSDDRVVVKYQHTDALGSPVAVSDQAGQITSKTLWEAWGGAIGKPAYDGLGYSGHMMDGATGLTYMQQRYYDQSVGRFLSIDPVTADKVTGSNFNRYWYGNNNPYRFTDPDGRQAQEMRDWRSMAVHPTLVSAISSTGGVTSVRLDLPAVRKDGQEGSSPEQIAKNAGPPNGVNGPKAAAAAMRAINSGRLMGAGLLKLGAGGAATTTGVGALPGIPTMIWGAWNLRSSLTNYEAAVQLAGEATTFDSSRYSTDDAVRVVVYGGIAPFGTLADDPGEPAYGNVMFNKAKNAWNEPIEFVSQIGSISP